jgi:PEP-CTERM motif
MNKSQLRTTLTALAVGAGFVLSAASAQAGLYTWDMSNGVASPGMAVPNGTTFTSTTGGPALTISASGFASSLLAPLPANQSLFEKNGGSGEIGLGLTNDPTGNNEITGSNVVVVNFSSVAGLMQSMSFDFKMNSTTATQPEGWIVLSSSTGLAGSFTTTVLAGSDEALHQNLPVANFYMFEATAGNVLLNEVSGVTSGVPEPSTWAMMLLGFLGLGFAFRQSRRKVSFA